MFRRRFARLLLGLGVCFTVHGAALPAEVQISRDPFQPPASKPVPRPAVSPQAQPPTHQLIGVVVVGDQAVAIFRNLKDGRLKMTRRGERIDGRRIKQVELDVVSYTQ